MACARSPMTLASLRSRFSLPRLPRNLFPLSRTSVCNRRRSVSMATWSRRFDWDEVVRVSDASREDDDPSDLRGYFEKVRNCNRGSESISDFIPFVVEDHVVGYVHFCFAEHLRRFQDVFTIMSDNSGHHAGETISFHPSLRTPEERTIAVGNIIKHLGQLIPGIRNELYPVVSSFGRPVFFSLERAAAPYFGIKAYGVHMNGYVDRDGELLLWIGKRSHVKPTYPGMLDHLVAGGLPHGITCKKNLMKECDEEAGIPASLSDGAISVGAVSYLDIDGFRYKRDVLFCYDLKLPIEFIPKNEDGEVDSFKLIPVTQVAEIIQKTDFFKPNCALVIIDFLFRHGYIGPDSCGYLDLLRSLRSGDCS